MLLALWHTLRNHPSLRYLLALAMPAVGQLAMLPLYGHYLGSTEFGLLSIVQGSVFLLQILTANLLSAAVARFWNTHTGNDDMLKTALAFSAGLTLILSILSSIFPLPLLPGYTADVAQVLPIAVCIAGLSSIEALYLIACVQQKKSTTYAIRMFTHILASISGAWLFVLWFEPTHVQLLSGRLAGMLLGIGPWWIADMRKGKFQKTLLADMLKFTMPLIPYLLLNQLLNASDRWIVADTAGPEMTGYFTAALSLMALSEMAFQALKNVYQPDIYAAFRQHQPEMARQQLQKFMMTSLQLWALILIAAPVLLMIFFSDDFMVALPILPWLGIGFAFRFIFMHDSLPEFYAPGFWLLPITIVTGLISMLVLTPPLIQLAGIIGPGIAFACSRAAMALIMHVFSRKQQMHFAFSPLFITSVSLLLVFAGVQWYLPKVHTLWMIVIGLAVLLFSGLQMIQLKTNVESQA